LDEGVVDTFVSGGREDGRSGAPVDTLVQWMCNAGTAAIPRKAGSISEHDCLAGPASEHIVNNKLAIFLLSVSVTLATSIDDASGADAPLQTTALAAWAQGLFARQVGAQVGLPTFDGATAWLNSPPLTMAELRGKVVLVDFWTYSCINWRREFPYVRAWAQKYRDRGLVVIGVHSPEFTFEKDIDNVRRAVREIDVDYPVATDSNFAIWRAFGNAYWPALYFIDAQGRIRHHHFGEGDYEESETVLQKLLSEVHPVDVEPPLARPAASGAEAAANWADMRSAENYVGYDRTNNLLATPVRDQAHHYAAPSRVRLNQWTPVGDWTLHADTAVPSKANGRIVYSFHARDLNLVMGPATKGKAVRFRVSIDGSPPGSSRGVDVDEQGLGTVSSHRMYQLIRQSGAIADRRFEIEFLDPDVEVFSFTFG
jgi:thiol-disulfide isomerase/thioredoxin